MITITIQIQELRPEQIIKSIVDLSVSANQETKERVLVGLLRECQTQLFKIQKEEKTRVNTRMLEQEF